MKWRALVRPAPLTVRVVYIEAISKSAAIRELKKTYRGRIMIVPVEEDA